MLPTQVVGSNGALAAFIPLAVGHLLCSCRRCALLWLQAAVITAAVGLHVSVSILQACLLTWQRCLYLAMGCYMSESAVHLVACSLHVSLECPGLKE